MTTPAQPPISLIHQQRLAFYSDLISQNLLTVTGEVASIADKGNKASRAIALQLVRTLEEYVQSRLHTSKAPGQRAGKGFERVTKTFVENTFPKFTTLRPGTWTVEVEPDMTNLSPYQHLSQLDAAVKTNPALAAILGNQYQITPDVVVIRQPASDAEINAHQQLVDDIYATNTPTRAISGYGNIVHAVISCKWTLRSDRAQNTRSEALDLVRNRKGRLPHIVALTAEPTPSRIGSLALGTGDIDCVYHIALPELHDAVATHDPKSLPTLETMIEGQRLKDITDLPLDLCV